MVPQSTPLLYCQMYGALEHTITILSDTWCLRVHHYYTVRYMVPKSTSLLYCQMYDHKLPLSELFPLAIPRSYKILILKLQMCTAIVPEVSNFLQLCKTVLIYFTWLQSRLQGCEMALHNHKT